MPQPCVKCDEDRAIILIGTNGSFCRDCFGKYFAHKFRSSLGKNPVVRHGDKVAVAFSGGGNSSALLHVMLESFSPTAFKRLRFHPGIIFIDETAILSDVDYSKHLKAVESIMEKTGLPCHVVRLEEVLTLCGCDGQDFVKDANLSIKLKELFFSMKNLTSREELLYRLRCKLLACKAKELGYQHVFLGKTSTRLAVNILADLAQGRGAHLSLDTGFTDDGRHFGINLLQPMSGISAKEVAVYNALNKVPTVFFETFSTKQASNASIQRLTEDFVVSLSVDFPATETTVFRTANKLEMNKAFKEGKISATCHLCCGPLDNVTRKDCATALQAIDFTEKLCAPQFGTPDQPHLPKFCDYVATGADNNITDNDLNLCYCCQTLQKDLPCDEAVFENVFARTILLPRKLTDEEIREKLGGMLLDS